jgi:glycosyltransferase involved in cell wall biosynthesis
MNMSGSDRRLNILHIILKLTPTNGQYNEHCLPMLDKRNITICTYFKSIWGITPPAGITLYDGDDTLMGFFRALRTALEEKEYDVIHVHTPHAGFLLPMALIMYGKYRKLKPATVHTVQNSFGSFRLRHKLMFIPGLAFFQRLVFCSRASYESFPVVYRWLAGDRIHVVQNAVDVDRVDRVATAEQAHQSGHFTIATVGLVKIKNPFTVLEAFRRCNSQGSQLVFMGEGNLRPLLAREVDKLGLEKQVRMTGLIARDSVFEYFTRADLFVSASFGEGLPVAVLEAMACSRPVVLSDIPPHREIAEGVDFIPLIKPGDAAGFAREIVKFRDMPVSERTAIGGQCRKIVEERFSLTAMHAGLAEVYAQITGNQDSDHSASRRKFEYSRYR